VHIVRVTKRTTLAHTILATELDSGIPVSHGEFNTIDDIIQTAGTFLPNSTRNTQKKAFESLSAIADALSFHGISPANQETLHESIVSTHLDCHGHTVMYKSIAQFWELPIEIIDVPNHTIVYWQLPKNKRFYWDPVIHGFDKRTNEDVLKLEWSVSQEDIEKRLFLRPLELNEVLSYAHMRIGNYWNKQKEPNHATQHYKNALEFNEDNFIAHKNYALLLLQNKAFQKALAAISMSANIRPTAHTYLTQGHILDTMGNIKDAYACCKNACETDQNNFAAYDVAACIARKMGLYEESLQHFEHLTHINPHDPTGYRGMASVLQKQGKEKQAHHFRKRALLLSKQVKQA